MSVSIDSMEGHDFEYWCAGLLRKSGFSNVRVTQGSGDQGVDVLAERDGLKYAFQCKRYNQSVGNKAVQAVYAGRAMYGCDVAVVITNNYFTQSAKELAASTRVQLWDRTKIFQMAKVAGIFTERKEQKREVTANTKRPKFKGLKVIASILFVLFVLGKMSERKEEINNPQEIQSTISQGEVEIHEENPETEIIIDNIIYEIIDHHAVAVGVTNEGKESKSLSIANSVNEYTVSVIGRKAFYQCEELEEITIPDSVIEIGECAFDECRALKEVTIPPNLVTIQYRTFARCNSLEYVEIPEGVTTVGREAFANCGFYTLSLPNTLLSIEAEAFFSCYNLENVVIPDGVTSIGKKAFKNASSLSNIAFPDSLVEIGDSAFWGCTSLTTVTIPPNVSELDSSLFVYDENIKTIYIPKSCKIQSGDYPFSGCWNARIIRY